MAHRRGTRSFPDDEEDPDTPANAFYEVPPGASLGETPLPHPSSRRMVQRRWTTGELQGTPGWRCLDCPTVVRGADGALREASWIIHHDRNPSHHRELLP